MNNSTLLRIGKAVLLGWGLQWPTPPINRSSRGSIWVCPPDKNDEWTPHKAEGENWLEECLNVAGVPQGKDLNKEYKSLVTSESWCVTNKRLEELLTPEEINKILSLKFHYNEEEDEFVWDERNPDHVIAIIFVEPSNKLCFCWTDDEGNLERLNCEDGEDLLGLLKEFQWS